jgi:hypothetical protein
MNDATRRKFLTMAGVGTAAAGVAVIASPAGASAAPREDLALPADAEGAMVAYIRDVKAGELALLVEGHEVVVVDKPLVARLARAFAKA